MELRWFVERVTCHRWDDREDVYVTSTHESNPILQYRDAKDNHWKDLPTHYEETIR